MKKLLLVLILLINLEAKEIQLPKPKKETSLATKVLVFEGLFAINSYLSSSSPNTFGGVLGLLTPIFGVSYDKNDNIEWAPIISAEAIALYNLSIDEDNYSKSEVFRNNFIGWNLYFIFNYYFLKNDSNDKILVNYSSNSIKLAYSYKF